MRVRAFELRLIAAGSTVLWTVAAVLVLIGYRPGGPIDIVVGLAAIGPVVVAMVGVAWPPAARHDRAFTLTIWLGLLVPLLVVPSIGGIVGQLGSAGTQTLLPSVETAYPWLLALIGTSLFSGLGLARRLIGPDAARRRRFALGIALGLVMTAVAGSAFGGTAIANELALRDHAATFSRFGPTDAAQVPPPCDGPIVGAKTSHVELGITADVDARPVGWANLAGVRSGSSFRWSGQVAAESALGHIAAARTTSGAWVQAPGQGWTAVSPDSRNGDTLDLQAVDTGLLPVRRTTAETIGVEFIEGARARHCRIAVDGPTARVTLPEIGWFVGDADLHAWRGELDYWVFGDHQVGQLVLTINGDAGEIGATGLQATIRATMIVFDRGLPVTIVAPAR